MADKVFCEYCAPTRQLNHRQERFYDRFASALERISQVLVPAVTALSAQDTTLQYFFSFMKKSGLLAPRAITDTEYMHNRTRIVAAEAVKRGYEMRRYWLLNTPTNFFTVTHNGTTIEFEGLPGLTPSITTPVDNKEYVRSLMTRLGAPRPRGKQCTSVKEALRWAEEFGYPVVVKPHNGSLSTHTMVNLKNAEELTRAVAMVQLIRHRFIVEEHIPGSVFRATMVGDVMVACGRRDPPYVTGDGQKTVRELFIARDAERKAFMKSLGYDEAKIPPFPFHLLERNPESILPNGEILPLTWKVNVVYGASVNDVTADVHPENRALFERIAREVGLPCLALDFMAPSIAVPWQEQRCAVIELNSMPAIDLHYPPIITGDTQNIAGPLFDLVLLKKGR